MLGIKGIYAELNILSKQNIGSELLLVDLDGCGSGSILVVKVK